MTKNIKTAAAKKAEKKTAAPAPAAAPIVEAKKRGRPAMTPEQKAAAAEFRKTHPVVKIVREIKAKIPKGTKGLSAMISKLGEGLAVAISGLPEATIEIVKIACKAGHDLQKENHKKLEAAKLVAAVAATEAAAEKAKKAEKKAARIAALEAKLNELKSKAGLVPVAETETPVAENSPETAQVTAPVAETAPAPAASETTPPATNA